MYERSGSDFFRCFHYFFQIFIFWVFRGIKRARNGPKWNINKKWWYLQALLFHIFKVVIFLVVSGGKRSKNCPKWQKIMCHTLYLANHTSNDYHLWYTFVNWEYIQVFFSIFQNFDSPGCQGDERAKNGTKWQKITSIVLHISGTICDMIVVYVTHV